MLCDSMTVCWHSSPELLLNAWAVAGRSRGPGAQSREQGVERRSRTYQVIRSTDKHDAG
jgi:hypothetical protein